MADHGDEDDDDDDDDDDDGGDGDGGDCGGSGDDFTWRVLAVVLCNSCGLTEVMVVHLLSYISYEMLSAYIYMGQIPQDGNFGPNVVLFFNFWRFTVTKRLDFFKFSQLFWRDYVR